MDKNLEIEQAPFLMDKGSEPAIIAGPCSAESARSMLEVCRRLKYIGIKNLRAGAWKPRTLPGCFEGAGEEALTWILEAAAECDMEPMTEIATPAHLEMALNAGFRILWIGARTVTNPFAVQEIADAIAGLPKVKRNNLTILVKNPVSPDLELWIGALKRINDSGVRRIVAVHRGFYAPAGTLYRNIPEWRIPIELKRRYPTLPMLCDPSHIAGRRDLIAPLCQQAVDLKFDGLMIECHPEPDSALSDARQQITPERLGEIIESLVIRKNNDTSAILLEELRKNIDSIDDEIMHLLARRMEVSRRIGELKSREGIPVIQPERYNDMMSKRVEDSERLGLSASFMRNILAAIHEESVRQQLKE